MTVEELIKVLECQPKHNKVYICVPYDDGYGIAAGEATVVERDGIYNPGTTSIWAE